MFLYFFRGTLFIAPIIVCVSYNLTISSTKIVFKEVLWLMNCICPIFRSVFRSFCKIVIENEAEYVLS